MGCDIHLFIEHKLGNGPWIADKGHEVISEDEEDGEDGYKYVNDVDSSGRNYTLFGYLAGVRTEGPNAKGLPKDVSEMVNTASELYGDDGHSHSYCSLKQFKTACNKAGVYDPSKKYEPVAFSGDYNMDYGNLIAYLEREETRLKLELETEKMLSGKRMNTTVKTRLVFFFDN